MTLKNNHALFMNLFKKSLNKKVLRYNTNIWQVMNSHQTPTNSRYYFMVKNGLNGSFKDFWEIEISDSIG